MPNSTPTVCFVLGLTILKTNQLALGPLTFAPQELIENTGLADASVPDDDILEEEINFLCLSVKFCHFYKHTNSYTFLK